MRVKLQIWEIKNIDPKVCCEWLDHSYIPSQHSTTPIGSSQVKLKLKCNICIEAYVTHSHNTQFLPYDFKPWPNDVKPSLNLI